jgi:hypothetical protein
LWWKVWVPLCVDTEPCVPDPPLQQDVPLTSPREGTKSHTVLRISYSFVVSLSITVDKIYSKIFAEVECLKTASRSDYVLALMDGTPLSVEFHRLREVEPLLDMYKTSKKAELLLLPVNRVIRQRILSKASSEALPFLAVPPMKKKSSTDLLSANNIGTPKPTEITTTKAEDDGKEKEEEKDRTKGKEKEAYQQKTENRLPVGTLESSVSKVRELEKQLLEEKAKNGTWEQVFKKAKEEWESEKANLQKRINSLLNERETTAIEAAHSKEDDNIENTNDNDKDKSSQQANVESIELVKEKLKRKEKEVKAMIKRLNKKEIELEEREKCLASLEKEMDKFTSSLQTEQQRRANEEQERNLWKKEVAEKEAKLLEWEQKLEKKENKIKSQEKKNRRSKRLSRGKEIEMEISKEKDGNQSSSPQLPKQLQERLPIPTVASKENQRLEETAVIDTGMESTGEEEDPAVVEAIRRERVRWHAENRQKSKTARWEEMMKEQLETLQELNRVKVQSHSVIQFREKSPRAVHSMPARVVSPNDLREGADQDASVIPGRPSRSVTVSVMQSSPVELPEASEEDRSETEPDNEEDIKSEKSDTEVKSPKKEEEHRTIAIPISTAPTTPSDEPPPASPSRRRNLPAAKSRTWTDEYSQKKKALSELSNKTDSSSADEPHHEKPSPAKSSRENSSAILNKVQFDTNEEKRSTPFKVRTTHKNRPKSSIGVSPVHEELRFPKNATVTVLDVDNEKHMYYGEYHENKGWFPAAHAETLSGQSSDAEGGTIVRGASDSNSQPEEEKKKKRSNSDAEKKKKSSDSEKKKKASRLSWSKKHHGISSPKEKKKKKADPVTTY